MVQMQVSQNCLHHIWKLKELQHKVSLCGMLHLKTAWRNTCDVNARLSLDGANPCVGIEKEDCRIPLGVQHSVPIEDIVCRSILLHVKIPNCCDSNLFSGILLLLRIYQESLAAILLLLLHPAADFLLGSLDCLVKQVAELHRLPRPGFELLLVLPLHDTKSHVVAACKGRRVPSRLLGRIKDHMEMLFLPQIGHVNNPICPHDEEAMVNCCKVSRVVAKTSIRLDCHQRNGGDIGSENAHCTFTFLANCSSLQLFNKRWDHAIVERLAALLD
mmetsp:Transcript_81253/g.194966  ORF Transcript_81253/g.194966 Transcript_81253/m.194966 type:complete len:273 (+) Transcript_81253:279-1097(+)